jgi:hypothetical protein
MYGGALMTRCSEKTTASRQEASDERADDTSQSEVQGTYDDRFRAVYDVLERQLNNGDDIGSSAAVFISGEPYSAA